MDKIKGFFKRIFDAEHRKMTFGIIGGVVAAIVVIVVIVLFATGTIGNKNKKVEKQLTSRLEELGKDFYENFYYKQAGNDEEAKKNFLSNYSKLGIKINLDNLVRYKTGESQKILDEFKNANGDACNSSNTKVAIYPKEPYGQKNYTIEVTLDCGFDGKETTSKKADNGKETTTAAPTTTKATTTTKKKK